MLPCEAFNRSAGCLRGTSSLHGNVIGIGPSGLPQQGEPPILSILIIEHLGFHSHTDVCSYKQVWGKKITDSDGRVPPILIFYECSLFSS